MTVKAPKTYHALQMAIGQRAARMLAGGHTPTAVQLDGSDYIKFFEFWRSDHRVELATIAKIVAGAQYAQDPLKYLDVKYDHIKSALHSLDDGKYIDRLVRAALDGDISKEEQETLFGLLVQLGE